MDVIEQRERGERDHQEHERREREVGDFAAAAGGGVHEAEDFGGDEPESMAARLSTTGSVHKAYLASPRCLVNAHHMPETKPSAISTAEMPSVRLLTRSSHSRLGRRKPIGGRAGVLQRVALQQVHQAGEKADADGDGAGQQQKPWSMPSR